VKKSEFSVLDVIGNTPLIRIGNIYAKLEGVNPIGSINDRVATGIIEAAEREGALKIARKYDKVVTVLPDRAERYLSMNLLKC